MIYNKDAMNISEYIQKADSIVSNHCTRYRGQFAQVGVLLSGGIDSSVITSYVLKQFTNPTIFSMGTTDTKDRPFIDLFASCFNVIYEWVGLTEESIREALPSVSRLLIENSIEDSTMQRSLGIGYYLIFKRAAELGIQGIITGQGPDILFAGYHKYKQLSGVGLNNQIQKDLILLETDKRRDSAMAKQFGITLFNPYLEPDFVDFSLQVPAELKLKDGVEKYFMREWGRSRGLPPEIVQRPKKAFQYSTGLQKKVSRMGV
jgi:asparagine synthase (glutamine-hydrolysing)